MFLLFSLLSLPSTSKADDDYPYNTEVFQPIFNENGTIIDGKFPQFSPDGSQIAYIGLQSNETSGSSRYAIYVVDTDGTNQTLLYANDSIDGSFSGPKFSPDGGKIVFTRLIVTIPSKEGNMTIDVLEKNGTHWGYTEPEEIYRVHNNGLENPSFSPDGKRIIYLSREGGGYGDIWIIDNDGSNRTRLTFTEKGGMFPSYSSDGEKITYSAWNDIGFTDVWIMNADGTNQTRIRGGGEHPSFMPDGKILFDVGCDSPLPKVPTTSPSIWMISQDRTNWTLLVPTRISAIGAEQADVSSDGTKICFYHGFMGLYLAEDPDGNGIWEDSDGDHVADICDGYPLDPERGYRTDVWEEEENGFLRGFGLQLIASSILIAVPVVWWRKRR